MIFKSRHDLHLIILRFISLLLLIAGKSKVRKLYNWQWTEGKSANLQHWYSPLELCILDNDSNSSDMLSIKNDCLKQNPTFVDNVPNFKCKAGGAAKAKGSCRASNEASMKSHSYLQKAVQGYEDANQNYLGLLAEKLFKYDIVIDVYGDSVSSHAFQLATTCEIERKNVALPLFNGNDGSVSLKGVHFHLAKILGIDAKTMDARINTFDNIMIILNTGLHFNMETYMNNNQLSVNVKDVFGYLDKMSTKYSNKKFAYVWMETTAQHFEYIEPKPNDNDLNNPNTNGYYPAWKKKKDFIKSRPINDTSLEKDWRNEEVRKILASENFFNQNNTYFTGLPMRSLTEPMWDTHDGGDFIDCSHYCWSPMMYQPIYAALADSIAFFEGNTLG